MPVVPATLEAEKGESLEPGRWKLHQPRLSRWLTPVIPAHWGAEAGRSRATQEAEAGELLESGRLTNSLHSQSHYNNSRRHYVKFCVNGAHGATQSAALCISVDKLGSCQHGFPITEKNHKNNKGNGKNKRFKLSNPQHFGKPRRVDCPELRSWRPAWATWQHPISTKNTNVKKKNPAGHDGLHLWSQLFRRLSLQDGESTDDHYWNRVQTAIHEISQSFPSVNSSEPFSGAAFKVKKRHWGQWVPKRHQYRHRCASLPRGAKDRPMTQGTGAGEKSLSRSLPATLLPYSPLPPRLPARAREKELPFSSLDTHRPRTSAPNRERPPPRALTVVLVAVPPPRHAALQCTVEPRSQAVSAAGTVRPLADARAAAKRAVGQARRRSHSPRLPEAQKRPLGELRAARASVKKLSGLPASVPHATAPFGLPSPAGCFFLPPSALCPSGATQKVRRFDQSESPAAVVVCLKASGAGGRSSPRLRSGRSFGASQWFSRRPLRRRPGDFRSLVTSRASFSAQTCGGGQA
ncbi:hypothetical protein AAY473_022647 [Plecturocebus cupreus]